MPAAGVSPGISAPCKNLGEAARSPPLFSSIKAKFAAAGASTKILVKPLLAGTRGDSYTPAPEFRVCAHNPAITMAQKKQPSLKKKKQPVAKKKRPTPIKAPVKNRAKPAAKLRSAVKKPAKAKPVAKKTAAKSRPIKSTKVTTRPAKTGTAKKIPAGKKPPAKAAPAKQAAKAAPSKATPVRAMPKSAAKVSAAKESPAKAAPGKAAKAPPKAPAKPSAGSANKGPSPFRPTGAAKAVIVKKPIIPRKILGKPGPAIVLPPDYEPDEKEEFMNPRQQEFFRQKLLKWREDVLKESDETLMVLREESLQESDMNDRASLETDRSIELRTRDRQRKLLSKIDDALRRIDEGVYGYCEETGEPIGLKRLTARPIATLSLEAQERHERMERTHRED